MTQGTGGCFHAGDVARFGGVLVEHTVRFPKFSQALNWEKAPFRQHLEKYGCSMAFAQHEAITICCFWLLGVNSEFLPIERYEQLNDGEA